MTFRRIHRLTTAFLVMLSFLLPLQVAWGAAAAYCEHETTVEATKHFGHHQHEHKADSHDAAAKKSSAKKIGLDNDCASCHMSSSAIVADLSGRVAPLSVSDGLAPNKANAHKSALARAPDRPQWARLV